MNLRINKRGIFAVMGVVSLLVAASAFAGEPAATDAQANGVAKEAAETKAAEPFSFADFSWVPGGYAPPDSPMKTKYFTPELRLDTAYHYSFNNPADDTISGSSEVFRHGEFQVTQIGVGGDFSYNNIGFRLMTQFGMYSETTPRNDASPSRGQWNLGDAYRYISEAYATYHLDVMNGINIQAGIFMSYVGLWSYYNFDNWTYQPSYVSSNTPWFFNGVRAQIFPSDKLKIEPWLINGWQSYGKFNNQPGIGLQILYRPTGWLSVLGNQYYGSDDLGDPERKRFHTDDSVMVKYHDAPDATISKAAASLTFDAGCEEGDGVSCGTQYFLGFMAYNRLWFDHDRFALTVGGGGITNPGRYLVLLPPINGATAASGTPYFTESPGDQYIAWDTQVTADYMPNRNITFRLEFNHRQASVPYFTGTDGVTPPGGNQGAVGSAVTGWTPDLAKMENRLTGAMMIRM
ncbi:MAG: outer membrane beta-barrel protein [Oligoflexia bacterium]|nr:outer membrane beta-barrel protein [Oligoflexia bacterium]